MRCKGIVNLLVHVQMLTVYAEMSTIDYPHQYHHQYLWPEDCSPTEIVSTELYAINPASLSSCK